MYKGHIRYTACIILDSSNSRYLRENKEFVTNRDGVEKVSGAAILLFGKKPQQFFPRSYVRFIRYEGTEAKVGTKMNVVKDVIFEGTVLEVINKAIAYVQTQIKEYTFLGPKGLFVTIPEYPEFCWQELIVNAVAHRDYSIYGTDIQIKLFDDHFTVESPGFLPGLVRTYNSLMLSADIFTPPLFLISLFSSLLLLNTLR